MFAHAHGDEVDLGGLFREGDVDGEVGVEPVVEVGSPPCGEEGECLECDGGLALVGGGGEKLLEHPLYPSERQRSAGGPGEGWQGEGKDLKAVRLRLSRLERPARPAHPRPVQRHRHLHKGQAVGAGEEGAHSWKGSASRLLFRGLKSSRWGWPCRCVRITARAFRPIPSASYRFRYSCAQRQTAGGWAGSGGGGEGERGSEPPPSPRASCPARSSPSSQSRSSLRAPSRARPQSPPVRRGWGGEKRTDVVDVDGLLRVCGTRRR